MQNQELVFERDPRARAPLQRIEDELLSARDVQLYIKRDDLIHPWVSGNKWRKLKYNLLAARIKQHETLLTFGGAYSNHILATAHAGRLWGFRTVGIIRGEAYTPLNPVLAEAQDAGMELHYLERWRYRRKNSSPVQAQLAHRFGRFYLLPEGGTNDLALAGCQEILHEIEIPFDLICVPCGTGGTLAGLVAGLRAGQRATGFAVLRGEQFLEWEVCQLLARRKNGDVNRGQRVNPAVGISSANWSINFNYHFGGYAKSSSALFDFMESFEQRHRIFLDRIYTGKLVYGVYDLILKKKIARGTTIVVVHTGNERLNRKERLHESNRAS